MFTSGFSEVRVAQSSVYRAVLRRSLYVLFLLVIVLSVLLFTASNYPFGIFNPFLVTYRQKSMCM